MEGSVEKFTCDVRVHGWFVDKRYVRIRCHDRRCPDVIRAKKDGEIAIHVWDTTTGLMWTEWLPDPSEGGQ